MCPRFSRSCLYFRGKWGNLRHALQIVKRQRAEEAANAAAIQEAQKVEEELRKGRLVQEWNAQMSFLLADHRAALEGRSGTTVADSTADEKQQQGEAVGDVLRTGPSGSDFRREPTCRGLLDRLGRSSNACRAKDPFGGGESDVPVDFSSAEDQIHPDDDAVSESDFRS